MLPITWNEETQKWCVYDKNGTELWSTPKYADAVQFASDYAEKQEMGSSAVAKGLSNDL